MKTQRCLEARQACTPHMSHAHTHKGTSNSKPYTHTVRTKGYVNGSNVPLDRQLTAIVQHLHTPRAMYAKLCMRAMYQWIKLMLHTHAHTHTHMHTYTHTHQGQMKLHEWERCKANVTRAHTHTTHTCTRTHTHTHTPRANEAT